MPSFDIVSKINLHELDNAMNQARREVQARFDFKGSRTSIEHREEENQIIMTSETETRVKAVLDILQSKLVKRGVSLKALQIGEIKDAAGGMFRLTIALQQGIPTEKAREIVKRIKRTKKKIQAAIQGDQVRVSGKSIDDLQSIIQMMKADDLGIHMQFVNMRAN
jgi:uncharacterized protein YajQ (UPF0234 family)